jgi:hypothetical protein
MLLTMLHAPGADGPVAGPRIDITPPGAGDFLAPGPVRFRRPPNLVPFRDNRRGAA